MQAPYISLVVLSFRRFEQTTGPCLQSLLPQVGNSRYELLLVDNGSDDGSAQACAQLAAEQTSMVYLPLPQNLGFGGGMNRGVAQTSGEWVVLVNSDTLFPTGALEALQHTLSGVPANVGLVCPVSNAAGNGQCLPLPECSLACALQIGEAAMRLPTGLLAPSYRADFFCVAIRRRVWNELGGLDPAFGMGYYEDVDFSLRARAAGYEQLIAEDVFVVHAGSAVFSTMRPQQRELLKRNKALLRQRQPKVRFVHEREGNLIALQHLLQQTALSGWNNALRARAAWRWAALIDRHPRSLLKRWYWRWRLRPVARELTANGIVAAYPEVP